MTEPPTKLTVSIDATDKAIVAAFKKVLRSIQRMTDVSTIPEHTSTEKIAERLLARLEMIDQVCDTLLETLAGKKSR